jgi:hypothetical protein
MLLKYDAAAQPPDPSPGATGAAILSPTWAQVTGFPSIFYGVTELGGFLYVVGYTFTQGISGSEDYLIQKYDEAGTLQWTKTSGGANSDVLTDVVGIGDRLFAVGYTTSQGSGGAEAVILEIDPMTLDTLSTAIFGGAQDDKANGVATDGTYLYVVGESKSFAEGGNAVGQNDVMVLRYTLTQTITAGAGSGGSISPSGAVSVDYGTSQTFTITPSIGYDIADVVVDGVSKGVISSYSFTNVTADHTIAASFQVTYDSLGNAVKEFVTKPGIVNSLMAKLDNAKAADARGNNKAKAGMIRAFINEVEVQAGKAMSAEDAAVLIALAKAL